MPIPNELAQLLMNLAGQAPGTAGMPGGGNIPGQVPHMPVDPGDAMMPPPGRGIRNLSSRVPFGPGEDSASLLSQLEPDRGVFLNEFENDHRLRMLAEDREEQLAQYKRGRHGLGPQPTDPRKLVPPDLPVADRFGGDVRWQGRSEDYRDMERRWERDRSNAARRQQYVSKLARDQEAEQPRRGYLGKPIYGPSFRQLLLEALQSLSPGGSQGLF